MWGAQRLHVSARTIDSVCVASGWRKSLNNADKRAFGNVFNIGPLFGENAWDCTQVSFTPSSISESLFSAVTCNSRFLLFPRWVARSAGAEEQHPRSSASPSASISDWISSPGFIGSFVFGALRLSCCRFGCMNSEEYPFRHNAKHSILSDY